MKLSETSAPAGGTCAVWRATSTVRKTIFSAINDILPIAYLSSLDEDVSAVHHVDG